MFCLSESPPDIELDLLSGQSQDTNNENPHQLLKETPSIDSERSMVTAATSDYLGSISQQSSFDLPACEAEETRFQYPADSSAHTFRLLDNHLSTFPDFNGDGENTHIKRRQSVAPDLYKNVVTLHVPTTPTGCDVEDSANNNWQRRASLDDTLMSLYRTFHKMPENVK